MPQRSDHIKYTHVHTNDGQCLLGCDTMQFSRWVSQHFGSTCCPNVMVQCNLKLVALDCWCYLPNYTVSCPGRQYSRSSLPLKPRSLHITNMNYLCGSILCNKTYALNHLSVCKYKSVQLDEMLRDEGYEYART